MQIPKKYLHDKFVLLLVSCNAFLAFLCSALILLRAGIGQSGDFIVQYRANLGLSAYERDDSIIPILSFILFAILILVINVVLSIRTYHLRRTLSLTILGLGALILLLAIRASNALLDLL